MSLNPNLLSMDFSSTSPIELIYQIFIFPSPSNSPFHSRCINCSARLRDGGAGVSMASGQGVPLGASSSRAPRFQRLGMARWRKGRKVEQQLAAKSLSFINTIGYNPEKVVECLEKTVIFAVSMANLGVFPIFRQTHVVLSTLRTSKWAIGIIAQMKKRVHACAATLHIFHSH